MPVQKRWPRSQSPMTLQIYEKLLALNVGFDQVPCALRDLSRSSRFDRAELARFRQLAEEARAATTSYLTAIIEAAETEQAGRYFHKRIHQEKQDERE